MKNIDFKKIITAVCLGFFLYIPYSIFYIQPVSAIVDPLTYTNNKFGIHIISPTSQEASEAAALVNSNGGDWGYVTVVVESHDRDHNKWQSFFDDLRRRHLIPIVRLATEPEGNDWKLPYDGEETAWADFLNNLVWPTENRYVVIYNEPNQGQEWAGQVSPESYAKVLDKTITALKAKNPDFFVLNAGFDASAPNKPPSFLDEEVFLRQMNQAVPGIFNKLDGWVSHSYPNPGFAGSPQDSGRGTVRTWAWELGLLKDLGVTKRLPVFITETGWKHAEGIDYDKSLPTSDVVGKYLQEAFNNAWSSNQIVAVTPFLLDYQEAPFDHFSFKKLTGETQNLKILGASFPDSVYYPSYQALLDLTKQAGVPIQEDKAQLSKGTVYSSMVARQPYTIPLTFKNTGQSIWNDKTPLTLKPLTGQLQLGLEVLPTGNKKIEPGQEETFYLHLNPPAAGDFQLVLQLCNGDRAFNQDPLTFNVSVKSSVTLQPYATLKWKDNFAGEYLLMISSDVVNTVVPVTLNVQGQANLMEARYLLPDYNFQFTLQKPYYQPKTISLKVKEGVNKLNFGELEPDFLSALLNPPQLWKMLPFGK